MLVIYLPISLVLCSLRCWTVTEYIYVDYCTVLHCEGLLHAFIAAFNREGHYLHHLTHQLYFYRTGRTLHTNSEVLKGSHWGKSLIPRDNSHLSIEVLAEQVFVEVLVTG